MARCPYGKFKKCPESNKEPDGCQLWKEFIVSKRVANGDLSAPINVENTNKGDCAHGWAAELLIDLSARITGVQAATESFRNEVVEGSQVFMKQIAIAGEKQRIALEKRTQQLIGKKDV